MAEIRILSAKQRGAEGAAEGFWVWFADFLKQETYPYPGRFLLVVRMTIATTITMLLIMTFRIPHAAVSSLYPLLLPRESMAGTLRASGFVLASYIIGALYLVVGFMLFAGYPITHFLYVICSIFICFYVIKVVPNPSIATAFSFCVVTTLPIWDITAPASELVTSTLWAGGSMAVGLFSTLLVEYVFSFFYSFDPVQAGLVDRMHAVARILRCEADGVFDTKAIEEISHLALVGVSRLRQLASSSTVYEVRDPKLSGTISLTGRLVDLCAGALAAEADHPLPQIDSVERSQLYALATQMDQIALITEGKASADSSDETIEREAEPITHLAEVERAVRLLTLTLTHPATSVVDVAEAATERTTWILPDAFTNDAHAKYALRGCLAASACYIIYSAANYPELNTSLATCIITALSSVGSSRQKQLMRFGGGVFGGLLFGIGTQVLILPALSSITGFAVLFSIVTAIFAWIATASPRLSYLGIQMALAYDLINLQEFVPQTNLAVARDRVLGTALALLAMWWIFDALGSRPAVEVMEEAFVKNLRLLSELAKFLSSESVADVNALAKLREEIAAMFSEVNAQSDGVLFEIGPTRQDNLSRRSAVLSWQPRLRSVFFILVALLQFRVARLVERHGDAEEKDRGLFGEAVSQLLDVLSRVFTEPSTALQRSEIRAMGVSLQAAAMKEGLNSAGSRTGSGGALYFNLAETLASLTRDITRYADYQRSDVEHHSGALYHLASP